MVITRSDNLVSGTFSFNCKGQGAIFEGFGCDYDSLNHTITGSFANVTW